MAWFEVNKDKKVLDFEKQLRKENVNIFLIANPVNSKYIEIEDKKIHLTYINGDSDNDNDDKPEYELDYKCTTLDEMEQEFSKKSTCYEENFLKLEKSGIYNLEEVFGKNRDVADDDVINLVALNTVKLELKTLSQEDVNNEMNKDIEKAKRETGQESQARPIGQARDGSLVLAHFVSGRVVSQYGLMLCQDNKDSKGKQRVKIILVSDKNTWV